MEGQVFISHASADKELAVALTELLRLGGAAVREELFCTSLEGMGVDAGDDFVDRIRDAVDESPLVIQLITPAYMESTFCLCELGAQWVLVKNAFPFTVPPITHADLEAVQRQIQIGRIDEGADLDQLFQRVCAVTGREPVVVAWNEQREKFLAKLTTILAGLQGPTMVSAAKHDGMVAAYKEEAETVSALRAENDRLEKKLVAMSQAADAAERRKIMVPDGEQARLDALIATARTTAGSMRWIVKQALAAWAADVRFIPDWDDPDIETARAERQLILNEIGTDDYELELNESDPKVARAMAAIRDLMTFDPSPALRKAFEKDNDVEFDFSNRRVLKMFGIV